MKKIVSGFILFLPLMLLTACVSSTQAHQPIPITPPSAPTYVPAPTPRPVPPTTAPISEYSPAVDGARLLPPLVLANATEGVRSADFNEITATQWAANVGMGWNLGNTLDSHGGPGGFDWLGGGVYANTTVEEMEWAWVNHITTQENIQAIADAGFNTIRIPVTWFKSLDAQMNIREDWMARVQEIVDWSLDAGLKVVLNTHHDEYIFDLRDRYMHESEYAFIRVWQQIAYRFRDYNERLMFEGLNEPRTIGTPAEWTGGTPEERHNLNILNQLFVDIVRASGGNNAYRVLMVPTYAASSAEVAQRALVIPDDIVHDRIVVSLHIYAPWEFALRTGAIGTRDTWDIENIAEVTPITAPLQLAYELFVSEGIPVIIGEMGALNRDNEAVRAEWAYFFVSYARNLGMPSIWWDNGDPAITQEQPWGWTESFGLFYRPTNTWVHSLIVEALMRAVQ